MPSHATFGDDKPDEHESQCHLPVAAQVEAEMDDALGTFWSQRHSQHRHDAGQGQHRFRFGFLEGKEGANWSHFSATSLGPKIQPSVMLSRKMGAEKTGSKVGPSILIL